MRNLLSGALLSLGWIALLVVFAGCGDDANPAPSDTTPDASPAPDDATPDGSGAPDDATAASDTDVTHDHDEIDEGPEPELPPAPPSPSAGACPELSAGTNTIMSNGIERRFELFLPQTVDAPSLLFMWHGAGDNPGNFSRAFGAASIATNYDTIVVVPYATGHFAFEWGFGPGDDASSDQALFDDALSCIVDQYDVDTTRVYTTGFSAGALWSTSLLVHRSEYFAAVLLLSGGTGTIVRYATPARRVPVLATHGGPTDQVLIVKFDEITETMADQLTDDGHTVVVCAHGLGHRVPQDTGIWGVSFLFEHAYSDAPLDEGSLRSARYPDYCELWSDRANR